MIKRLRNAKIPWVNYLIELVVVFISVTLAFTLNQCQDNNRKAALEQKYINDFYDELLLDQASLDSVINESWASLDKISKLLDLINSEDFQNDSLFDHLTGMITISFFFANRSTYQSIISSGNLGVISDYQLKSGIINYYQEIESGVLVENYYRLHINEYVLPFFYDHVDMQNVRIVPPAEIRSLRFANIVTGSSTLLYQNVQYYLNLQETCKALAAQLEKARVK